MSARKYARIARQYWETYLPSQFATAGTSPQEIEAFFLSLGTQVQEQIDSTADQIAFRETQKLPPQPTPAQVVAAHEGARKAAEELALTEMVFLTPEPGTESRRLVGSVLPGWEDEASEAPPQ